MTQITQINSSNKIIDLDRQEPLSCSSHEERGLASSPLKYIAIAVIIGSVAAAVFTLCPILSFILIGVAGWFLWSGTIIAANKTFEKTAIARPVQLLHAAAMEVNAGVVSACLFPFTLLSSYHKAKGNLHGRPILLINGYLSFGSTWHYIREQLVNAGLGPIYTMNVGTGYSIQEYAKQVQEKVKEIALETKRKDLILIGHSKGGLVSSEFATSLAKETETEVTDVITIGSPLTGTPVAYIGIGCDASEMRPDTPFNKDLRERIANSPHIRFHHVGSEADEVIPINSSLIGKNFSRQLLLKDVGHLALVFSSRVADQICKWLKP